MMYDDDCGTMGGMIDMGNRSTRINVPQFCVVPHKSHLTRRGLELGPLRREAGD
jgi:hypothetical protein